MAIPADLALDTRAGLPDALRVLLADYPRAAWQADPGFSDLIRFWLERHLMFRRILEVVDGEVTDTLDRNMDEQVFASHLRRYTGFFIQELHTHHTIEDQNYFPKLKSMDERIAQGFDLLDKDHHDIDADLHDFAQETNALLADITGAADARPGLDAFRARLTRITGLLDRHLTDEEDLVVPVLLKYAPSGLV